MSENLNNKVVNATKWSAITEFAAKLISPLSTIILARILTPDAFGVLVTATMVISFAEIFTDAGFQKYIIQHTFDNEESLNKASTVAFWSNLVLSILLWMFICFFSPQIAALVGNEGYGLVIAISSICLPLGAISSIQMAILKRKLSFKSLFYVRIIGIFIPLVVTIPLALITHSYWSLIIGLIALNISNAILLTIHSSWRPKIWYDFRLLKDMFSFTIWTIVESITIWLTGYIDIFIVGTVLSTHHMGIYRTGITLVGSILAIITNTTTSVLFSALSSLQNDEENFKKMFLKFQKIVAMLILPMGVGIYLFRDFVTEIALGDQWQDASFLIGIWALTSTITIVYSHYGSEIFRSKGKPQLSALAQTIHLLFLVPIVLISVEYGFESLCLWRSIARFTMVLIVLILLYPLVHISFLRMTSNISHTLVATIAMWISYLFLPEQTSVWISLSNILICSIVYIVTLSCFKEEREIFINLKRK